MNESIELKNFTTNYSKGSDSEEYHEISLDVVEEESQISKLPLFSEHDFFTQYENKKIKNKPKKKKGKKKEKVKDLMDVINTEIAEEPFLSKNNIVTFDYTNEVSKYLKVPYIRKKSISMDRDAERGYHTKIIANISPIFPFVLENTTNKKSQDVQVQYMGPTLFDDIVTDYEDSDRKRTPKFLDVILRNIKFKHHHDFSLEKLLCVKLTEVYEEYVFVKTTLTDLLKNIDVNRRTRSNLKEKLLKISPNKKDDARFDSNVLKYTKLMLEYKERYFKMLKREKQLLHKLKSLWSDIENVREKSECRTDYILELNELNMDDEDFKNEWNQIFEREYSDLIIKKEYEFIIKYLEYKESKSKKDEEKKRNPKPKLNIDYDELRTEVENIVAEILPQDKMEVILKQDKNILSNLYDYSKGSYKNNYFKIYVDNVFVCESEVYESKGDQWDVDFEECLSIEILPQNSDLRIVLYENDDDVSVLRLNLSDIKKNTNETNYFNKEFDYTKIVEPTSKTIGSGFDLKYICSKHKVRLKSSNMFKGKIYTKCETSVKIGWNEKLNNNTFESIKSCTEIGAQLKRMIGSKDQASVKALIDIISELYERKVDDNESIVRKLEEICKGSLKKEDSFGFKHIDIDMIRFKLLYKRHNGYFVSIQNKVVPLFPTQISTEQLNSLQKSEKQDIDYIKLESSAEMDVIDLQRYIGMKYVERLNKNLIMNINECLLKKTYKDVVKDFNVLNWRFDEPSDIISNQQVLLKQESLKEQEIYITVLRAFNLSDRSAALLTEESADDDDIAGYKVHPLRPFVRASYHGVYAQTATAIGCYPTWNHTMKIKTKFEPLSSIHINIYDECKDNASELHSDEHSAQSTVYYRKSNKWLGTVNVPLHTVLALGNIRGAFKITSPPFTFGYENIKTKESQSLIAEISQLFKKDTSFIVLQISTSMSRFGGLKNYNQPIPTEPNDSLICHINEFLTEYVNDFPTRNISLTFIDSSGKNKCASEFLQPIPLPDYDFAPTNPKKAESAISKSSGHSRSSSSRSSRKRNSVTEESISGFEVNKSEGNLLAKNMEMAIRYVSLIPTYEVTESHVVTLMGMELLKVLYGSPLDHTILLASFFIHLGIKCWIVIGFGLPRGLSSYVLVKYHNNKILMADCEEKRGLFNKSQEITWYIFDAVAGERFELRDVGCPLKTVSHVFDCENIWVNMQATEDCESVSFDFAKSSNWQAVFDKPLFVTRPIITDSLYSKPGDVEKLRFNIETKIKNKVQKWRSHVKTIWNRYCSSLLKEMLPHYEYWAFNPTEPRPNLGNRLKQLMATYKIFGFPLNMPYLNTKLIISSVKSTAMHINDDPSVEFGLAVEVYSYPNNVISVWVFLASITRIY